MRAILPLVLALAACAPADPHADPPDRVARRVTARTGATGDVVDGANAFAWDLYAELAAADANLLFSPLSVSAALGMTAAGAAGDTATQLAQALHATEPADAWHAAFGELLDDLGGDKARGYQLSVANRLFGQQGLPWAAPFLARCEDDWHAPLEDVDFAADPEAGTDRVNAWVAEQTADRIPELLPPGLIDTDTRLVLANAISFLASWWTRFDVQRTAPSRFRRLDGSAVQVDMMWLDLEEVEDARVRASWTDEAVVVRLPYEDDEVAAYLVIPGEADGLPALEASLDAAAFEALVAPVAGAGREEGLDEGVIGLPRLSLRWKASLLPALRALGVVDLFDGDLADLSPMADDGAADQMFVAEVLHEAWMRVDEEGTEAAAATAVVTKDVSAPVPMVADHPFLFVIRDDLTGSVLFVARVLDPAAG
ncbi:MAG: serpin family protein [Alphaproteobacteria bacterium]|nr:serpin family protein [Alphaproteobacteria bacterium]